MSLVSLPRPSFAKGILRRSGFGYVGCALADFVELRLDFVSLLRQGFVELRLEFEICLLSLLPMLRKLALKIKG